MLPIQILRRIRHICLRLLVLDLDEALGVGLVRENVAHLCLIPFEFGVECWGLLLNLESMLDVFRKRYSFDFFDLCGFR